MSYSLRKLPHIERLGLFHLNDAVPLNGTGNAANNIIQGHDGANVLKGLAGNDLLQGFAGTDTLIGGKNKDKLTGGDDADIFDFNRATEIGRGAKRDVITDFQSVQLDQIDLSNIDARKGPGNQSFTFIDTQKFHKTKGELHYKASGVECRRRRRHRRRWQGGLSDPGEWRRHARRHGLRPLAFFFSRPRSE